jgi:hypothetical protein
MVGLFGSIGRVLTGKVLHQIDTVIMGGYVTVSLRLKERQRTNTPYVVLAGIAQGNYQYYSFDLDEFDQFVDAAKLIQAESRSLTAPGGHSIST